MPCRKWRPPRQAALAALGLCISQTALAQETAEAISITLKNDALTGSVDAYSRGFEGMWTYRNVASSPRPNPARAWTEAGSFMQGVSDPFAERYVPLTLAELVHTPEDITLETPQLDDRPHAGVLDLNSLAYRGSPHTNDAWTLRLGMGGPTAQAEKTTGALSVTLENDSFTGSDDAYSNGAGLTWTSRNVEALAYDNPARVWARVWSVMPGVTDPDAERYVSLTLAQEIHTPEDITLDDPPLDDRPYAGVLYLDSVVYRRTPRMNDAWTLRLGVVGPASHADDTQTWIHELIGADEPRGWHTQLPNELVANLGYTADFRGPEGELSDRVRWRVTPTINAEIGTYATVAGAGALLEVGYNLPRSARAVSSLRSGLNAAGVVGWREDETELSVSANFGVAGYAVARFLPLDGTVFRDSRSVDYDPYVTVFTAGATVRYADYALNFNVAFSSDDAGGRGDAVDFGALTLSRRF